MKRDLRVETVIQSYSKQLLMLLVEEETLLILKAIISYSLSVTLNVPLGIRFDANKPHFPIVLNGLPSSATGFSDKSMIIPLYFIFILS